MSLLKEKFFAILKVYALIFIPMWSFFIFNNILLQDGLNGLLGIHPRDFSFFSLVQILSSWMLHSSNQEHIYSHILGNSQVLFSILWLIALIEKNPFKTLASLVFFSGLATWLIGSPNSVHVGASGLVFALFGYILASIIFNKKWLYIIPVVLFGSGYIYSIQMGLIPQQGVSFAAHFGGFVSAIVLCFINYKIEKKQKQSSFKPNKTKIIFQKFKKFFKK